MSKVKCECKTCGHSWMANAVVKNPRRCPKKECRSKDVEVMDEKPFGLKKEDINKEEVITPKPFISDKIQTNLKEESEPTWEDVEEAIAEAVEQEEAAGEENTHFAVVFPHSDLAFTVAPLTPAELNDFVNRTKNLKVADETGYSSEITDYVVGLLLSKKTSSNKEVKDIEHFKSLFNVSDMPLLGEFVDGLIESSIENIGDGKDFDVNLLKLDSTEKMSLEEIAKFFKEQETGFFGARIISREKDNTKLLDWFVYDKTTPESMKEVRKIVSNKILSRLKSNEAFLSGSIRSEIIVNDNLENFIFNIGVTGEDPVALMKELEESLGSILIKVTEIKDLDGDEFISDVSALFKNSGLIFIEITSAKNFGFFGKENLNTTLKCVSSLNAIEKEVNDEILNTIDPEACEDVVTDSKVKLRDDYETALEDGNYIFDADGVFNITIGNELIIAGCVEVSEDEFGKQILPTMNILPVDLINLPKLSLDGYSPYVLSYLEDTLKEPINAKAWRKAANESIVEFVNHHFKKDKYDVSLTISILRGLTTDRDFLSSIEKLSDNQIGDFSHVLFDIVEEEFSLNNDLEISTGKIAALLHALFNEDDFVVSFKLKHSENQYTSNEKEEVSIEDKTIPVTGPRVSKQEHMLNEAQEKINAKIEKSATEAKSFIEEAFSKAKDFIKNLFK